MAKTKISDAAVLTQVELPLLQLFLHVSGSFKYRGSKEDIAAAPHHHTGSPKAKAIYHVAVVASSEVQLQLVLT